MDDCGFDEIVLLDYLLGAASPGVRVQIEQTAACQAAAQQLAAQLGVLYRVECPDAPTLIAYQERRIGDSTLQLVLRQHVAHCSHCTEELALLAAIDTIPLVPQPAPVRRLLTAVFQSPLLRAQAVRGDLLQYQIGQMSIHLRVRLLGDRRGMWTVRGQLRVADGRLAANLAQSVRARPSAAPAQVILGAIEAQGAFRLDGLRAGMYALELDTPDCTIVINQLSVGNH